MTHIKLHFQLCMCVIIMIRIPSVFMYTRQERKQNTSDELHVYQGDLNSTMLSISLQMHIVRSMGLGNKTCMTLYTAHIGIWLYMLSIRFHWLCVLCFGLHLLRSEGMTSTVHCTI